MNANLMLKRFGLQKESCLELLIVFAYVLNVYYFFPSIVEVVWSAITNKITFIPRKITEVHGSIYPHG